MSPIDDPKKILKAVFPSRSNPRTYPCASGDHIVVLTEDSVVWIFAYAPDVRDYLAVRIENYVTPVLASNGNHLSVMGNMSV